MAAVAVGINQMPESSCCQEDGDACGPFVAQEREIEWLRSSLVSLLTLAEAENSPLTNKQVASICKVALNKHEGN